MKLTKLVDIDNTEAVLDRTDREEETALHKQMVQYMQVRSGHAIQVSDSYAQGNVTKLGNTGISQHTAEIGLGQSHNRSENHTCCSENADQSCRINDNQVLDSKDEEE